MKITTRAALIFLAALVCLTFWAFSVKAQDWQRQCSCIQTMGAHLLVGHELR